MIRRYVIAAALSVAILGAAATAAESTPVSQIRAAPANAQAKLRLQEAAFLRTVDRQNTANVVTGDLVHYAGTHVAYICDVDNVVKPGLILGQCGSEAEPMDLFVHLSTTGIRVGDRLEVLGVMEQPAMWTDITGHTVYYAFLKAIFVNRKK
jgi:hypothetical protein